MLSDLALISPLLIVTVMGLVALLVAVFTPNDSFKGWLGYVTVFGYVLALASLAWIWPQAPAEFTNPSFANALTVDKFGLALCAVILGGAILITLTAVHYLPAQQADHGEFYALVAFATLGMMTLVMAADLLTLFVALEVMSIAIYILAGFKRQSRFSTESAMKYFILGSFASAILLLGIAFTYGATGKLGLADIGAVFSASDGLATNGIALIGMVMLVVAFAFKIAAAPFHMWTPDVYEGAPAAVTGFMAVGVKAAAFGALARLLLTCFGEPELRDGAVVSWETLIAILAVISMFGGNLMALGQRNLKRMLAYSAIAHTGYLLLALLVVPTASKGGEAINALGAGLVFYLLAYTAANCAAFGVAAAVSDDGLEDVDEAAYAGLAKRSPGHAAVLAISMLSLLGIPLTAGFMGKLTIFGELLDSGNSDWLWLVIVAVINSVISAFYYLRVILVAYMQDEARPIRLIKSRPLGWALAGATIATLVFGVIPNKGLRVAQKAGRSLVHTTQPNTAAATADATPIDDASAPRVAAP